MATQKQRNVFINVLASFGVLFAVFIWGVNVHVSSTQASDETELTEDQEEDLEDNLIKQEKLLEKKTSYENIIQLKANQARTLNSQIASLAQRAEGLEEDIAQNQSDLGSIEGDMNALVERIKKEDEAIEVQKTLLARLLESYYELGKHEKYGHFILDEQFNFSFDRVEDIQSEMRMALENIVILKRALEADKDALESKRKKTVDLQERLEQQSVYLESSKVQKASLLVQTQTEQSQYQKKLSKVEEDLRDIEREIEEIEAIKSGMLDYGSIPPAKNGYFRYPIRDVRISQGYGKTTFTRWYTFHNGVDFAVPTGTPIHAVRDGKVIGVGDNGRYAYGKWVAIDHGDGLVTLYGHMSVQTTSKGKKLDEGDIIGKIGNTGYSTGPHLHFSVFSEKSFEVVNSSTVSGLKIPTGAHVNPMRYLE